MEKIKVCFVKFADKAKKIYLFEMPWDSYLDKGDTVIVPSAFEGATQEGTVVDTDKFRFEYTTDQEEFNRLLGVAGVEMPLKRVIGKVERTYFEWEGAENEDED